MSVYVPTMQITWDVYGGGAGTNTNSAHPSAGTSCSGWGWDRESRKLLRFGLETVNSLVGISLDAGCLKRLHIMFQLYCRHPQRLLCVGTIRKCCYQTAFAAVKFWVYAFMSGTRSANYVCASGNALSYFCSVVSFLGVFWIRSPWAVFL